MPTLNGFEVMIVPVQRIHLATRIRDAEHDLAELRAEYKETYGYEL